MPASEKHKLRTTPFDASQYLDDSESQAELLSDALATGDSAVVAHALGVIARARGMTEIQRLTGLNRATLYSALNKGGNPTLETVMKVLSALKVDLSAHARAETHQAA